MGGGGCKFQPKLNQTKRVGVVRGGLRAWGKGRVVGTWWAGWDGLAVCRLLCRGCLVVSAWMTHVRVHTHATGERRGGRHFLLPGVCRQRACAAVRGAGFWRGDGGVGPGAAAAGSGAGPLPRLRRQRSGAAARLPQVRVLLLVAGCSGVSESVGDAASCRPVVV